MFHIIQGVGQRPRLQCPLASLEVHVHVQDLKQNSTGMQVILIIRDANRNYFTYSRGRFIIQCRDKILFFARKTLLIKV